MISDVLFEARQELERYQRDFDNYKGMEEEIEVVKVVMANLQMRLDVPFPDKEPRFAPPALLLKDIPERERVRDYVLRTSDCDLLTRYNEITGGEATVTVIGKSLVELAREGPGDDAEDWLAQLREYVPVTGRLVHSAEDLEHALVYLQAHRDDFIRELGRYMTFGDEIGQDVTKHPLLPVFNLIRKKEQKLGMAVEIQKAELLRVIHGVQGMIDWVFKELNGRDEQRDEVKDERESDERPAAE
jgi:hypothetical protein